MHAMFSAADILAKDTPIMRVELLRQKSGLLPSGNHALEKERIVASLKPLATTTAAALQLWQSRLAPSGA